MRLPLLFLVTAGLMAAPAVKVSVASARVVLGPGIEPQAGAEPHLPRVDAQFHLSGLPRGAKPSFRFWRATGQALASLPKGRAIQAGAGIHALEGEAVALPGGTAYQLKATTKAPWNGPESLIIEVRSRGRLVARGTAPILETNLPGAARREGMEP